jgi:hypothetical protein
MARGRHYDFRFLVADIVAMTLKSSEGNQIHETEEKIGSYFDICTVSDGKLCD